MNIREIFDERRLKRCHILAAISDYHNNVYHHRPPRSAFLMWKKRRLPAKFILKLAWKQLTGVMPKSEQLTGGRASCRVLGNLGFQTKYVRPAHHNNKTARQNKSKARREAFKRLLIKKWGNVITERRFPRIQVPDLSNRKMLPR